MCAWQTLRDGCVETYKLISTFKTLLKSHYDDSHSTVLPLAKDSLDTSSIRYIITCAANTLGRAGWGSGCHRSGSRSRAARSPGPCWRGPSTTGAGRSTETPNKSTLRR